MLRHGLSPPQDGSVGEHSDDNSWKQLNQVASVDEAVLREQMVKQDDDGRGLKVDHPASNSSSLTNSPTDGHHAEADKRSSIPTPSKLASLDSLSSVASAQEPLTTGKDKSVNANNSVGHLSPGSSASLDLMKCSSGSSGLLHLASQGLSFPPPPSETRLDTKRSRDEEREDADSVKHGERPELRRAPTDPDGKHVEEEARPKKKGRIDESADLAKHTKSPLSIACSPPHSPAGKSKDGRSKVGSSHPGSYLTSSKQDRYIHQSPGQLEGSYFDKAPSYTYSMDSAPPLPKDSQRPAGYPPLPHRPG